MLTTTYQRTSSHVSFYHKIKTVGWNNPSNLIKPETLFLSSLSLIIIPLSNDTHQWCMCIKYWTLREGCPLTSLVSKTSLLLEVRLYTDVNGATVGASLCTNVRVLWYINGGTASTVMAIVRTKPTAWRRARPPNPPMLAPYSTAHIYSSLWPPALSTPSRTLFIIALDRDINWHIS